VLDGLPGQHRTEPLHVIGRQTLAALPARCLSIGIVEAARCDQKAVIVDVDHVDESVLRVDAPRPEPGQVTTQLLRFADTAFVPAHNVANQYIDSS
jgi:hypothetical protein